MTIDRWLVVPRWESFQHRDAARQAVPTWIKLHTRLLSDENYLQLTPTRRCLLVGIWLEYARTRRGLPDDTATLSRRLAQRVLRSDLEALSDAGFLLFSASEHDSEIAVTEKRREEVPPNPRRAGEEVEDEELLECERCGKPVRPRSRCLACGATPRQAGTNTRRLAKPSDFERARSLTRNVGASLEEIDFVAELSQFKLSVEQREELAELRAQQLNGDTNPFIDEEDAT